MNQVQKIRLFAQEIKAQVDTIFKADISTDMFVFLESEYKRVLRCKKRNDDNPIYRFFALDTSTGDLNTYVIRNDGSFENDGILKLIICVELFHLSYQQIKKLKLK